MSTSFFKSCKNPSIEELKKYGIPKHVAVIMDGNGRWATSKKLPRIFGHKKGAETLRETVITCKDLGIKYLTAYAFSNENWQRPRQEVLELMKLFVEVLGRELEGLIRNDVKLNLIGLRELIPSDILAVFENAEEKTKHNKTLVFNIAFSYGSRQEIFQAAKKMAFLYREGLIDLEKSDHNIFEDYLLTAGIPYPDLLIRTSGEYRLSNFLLWQIAYTELYFTKVLWPDFGRKHFLLAIKDYQQRQRRFGKL
ncbi:MAG: isoprenyl transferase [Actinobacteria bacterium]|nr:isoprenyl transferase [Actinomycetota bacterium]